MKICGHLNYWHTPIGIPSKEAKAEIEIYPVTVEAKIRKFRVVETYLCFLLINSSWSVSLRK